MQIAPPLGHERGARLTQVIIVKALRRADARVEHVVHAELVEMALDLHRSHQ